MTRPTLAQLRAIAERATSGPWTNHEEHGFPYVLGPHDELLGGPLTIVDGAENLSIENAAHITAFNPATALALIDRIERLERLVEEACTSLEHDDELRDRLDCAARIRKELSHAE